MNASRRTNARSIYDYFNDACNAFYHSVMLAYKYLPVFVTFII